VEKVTVFESLTVTWKHIFTLLLRYKHQ